MSVLQVTINGIPDRELPLVAEALASQAAHLVDHFDVFSGERYHVNQGPDIETGELLIKEVTHRIMLKIRGPYLTSMIKWLNSYGKRIGTIDVVQVRCTNEALPMPPLYPEAPAGSGAFKRWFRRFVVAALLDRTSTLEIHSNILANCEVNFNHLVCIGLASAMAAVGLLTDSAVDILASFFVSPLMNMILVLTWGIAIRDWKLAARGLRNMVIGAAFTVINGALAGAVVALSFSEHDLRNVHHGSFLSVNTGQILSRGPPVGNLAVAGVVACVSGVALVLGQANGLASALIGVCISASLLPPLVNTGLLLMLQFFYPNLKTKTHLFLSDIGIYSIYLYLVNVSLIILFAFITLKAKHIGGRTLRSMTQEKVEEVSIHQSEVTAGSMDVNLAESEKSSGHSPTSRRGRSTESPLLQAQLERSAVLEQAMFTDFSAAAFDCSRSLRSMPSGVPCSLQIDNKRDIDKVKTVSFQETPRTWAYFSDTSAPLSHSLS